MILLLLGISGSRNRAICTLRLFWELLWLWLLNCCLKLLVLTPIRPICGRLELFFIKWFLELFLLMPIRLISWRRKLRLIRETNWFFLNMLRSVMLLNSWLWVFFSSIRKIELNGISFSITKYFLNIPRIIIRSVSLLYLEWIREKLTRNLSRISRLKLELKLCFNRKI